MNRWRADTYRAIAASEGYDYQVNEKSMRTEALIERLLRYSEYRRGEIGDACGERDKRRGHSWYLQERVLKPAAELATKMRFCEDEYFWSWKAPRPMMKKRDLERFEVFDLKSHCTVVQSENRFADLSDNDTLGKCLFSIFPALYKRGKAGKPDSVVSRGWAAVVLRSHLANWCDVDAKESPQFPFDEDDRHIFGLEDLQLT